MGRAGLARHWREVASVSSGRPVGMVKVEVGRGELFTLTTFLTKTPEGATQAEATARLRVVNALDGLTNSPPRPILFRPEEVQALFNLLHQHGSLLTTREERALHAKFWHEKNRLIQRGNTWVTRVPRVGTV